MTFKTQILHDVNNLWSASRLLAENYVDHPTVIREGGSASSLVEYEQHGLHTDPRIEHLLLWFWAWSPMSPLQELASRQDSVKIHLISTSPRLTQSIENKSTHRSQTSLAKTPQYPHIAPYCSVPSYRPASRFGVRIVIQITQKINHLFLVLLHCYPENLMKIRLYNLLNNGRISDWTISMVIQIAIEI